MAGYLQTLGWFDISDNRMARMIIKKDIYARDASAECDALVGIMSGGCMYITNRH